MEGGTGKGIGTKKFPFLPTQKNFEYMELGNKHIKLFTGL